MTPEELSEKLDKALDQALTLCTTPKEYAEILKIGVDYYGKRKENTETPFGAALGKGRGNGG